MTGIFNTMILTPQSFDPAGAAFSAGDLSSLEGLPSAMAEAGWNSTASFIPAEPGRDLASLVSGLRRLRERGPVQYLQGAWRFLLLRPFRMFNPAQAIVGGAVAAVGVSPFAEHFDQIVFAFSGEVLAVHPYDPSIFTCGVSLSATEKRFREKFPSLAPTFYWVNPFAGPEASPLFLDDASPEILFHDSWDEDTFERGKSG